MNAQVNSLPKNATYSSKDSQNEFLDISANIIVEHIGGETKKYNNGYVSLILDEVRVVSKVEQMSVCVRYVGQNSIEERFIGFIHLSQLNAESIANSALEYLVSVDFDPCKCIGQAYDGAAVMSGKINGVQRLLRQKVNNPCVYVHCYAHRLNLVLVDVSKPVCRRGRGHFWFTGSNLCFSVCIYCKTPKVC